MTSISLLAGVLLFATEPAVAAPPPPVQSPQHHQMPGPHRPDAVSVARCCCEEMHKMMMEMIEMHKGTGTSHSANPEKTPPQSQQNQ